MIVYFILGVTLLTSPFLSFGKSLDEVVIDAAHFFGIEEHEYEIEFISGRVLNAAGEEVSGTINEYECEEGSIVYKIRIQRSILRPLTIATIFHEFAHAAQLKYELLDKYDMFGEYNREQHAELYAFNVMWQSGYWWNAVHMLILHTFGGKPSQYRAPATMWNTVLTGANAV